MDDSAPRRAWFSDPLWRVAAGIVGVGAGLWLVGALPLPLALAAGVGCLVALVYLFKSLIALAVDADVEDDPDWWMASGWPDPTPRRSSRRAERRFADDVEGWLAERSDE